ncbi:LOW QUALITY PROTEIN: uncharacterized protein B0I36DRAFT_378241 [Microdochium trichocladiopsis]|uniref:Uncharacterized protein n=1 Tax=Microdochium trichocladiopsis TaxID=1682393 RepID=A0A9P8XSJ5_9PEZI|nr:LOW QUALITY PROTEIN: uncharacterized protein B0I36DRAFT_378241 [Microdochium trichocladiopsis]KAH7014618.1 LOW QUALITY PROTEIN: hypothetical protein B0I36DRAFT_378241 [Microdochium trichocladiopsis]
MSLRGISRRATSTGKPRPDRGLAYSTTMSTYSLGEAARIDDIGLLLHLGRGLYPTTTPYISIRADEIKISGLVTMVDWVLFHCEQTARETSRAVLCWFRSLHPDKIYPKPFTLVSARSSRQKYLKTFQRFIAFIFRTYRLLSFQRQDLLPVRFNSEQQQLLGTIWPYEAWNEEQLLRWILAGKPARQLRPTAKEERSTLTPNTKSDSQRDTTKIRRDDEDDENDEDGENDEDDEDDNKSGHSDEDRRTKRDNRQVIVLSPALSQLLELLFKLCITFCTEDFADGYPSSTHLVGILSINPDGRGFRTAKLYTPFLSALIYNQRLLFLEYALPLRAYEHIGIPRRPRHRQFERLDTSMTPLTEMLSLRDYGRVIARTDTPSFFLHWSDDLQTLSEHFIGHAEERCEQLMLGLQVDVHLERVKDDLVNAKDGFSFISHPHNKLSHAYAQLLKQACTPHSGLFDESHGTWKATAKIAERLLEFLAGCFHTTSGQTGRAFGERGLYIHNGSVMTLIRHHKAKRSTNREFNVVRFLPLRVGRVIFRYLVYIRPFLTTLGKEPVSSQRSLSGHIVSPPLLFSSGVDRSKPWDASKLAAIFKKATSVCWDTCVNPQIYRQIAIGITEKHVIEIATPFNRYDDLGPNASINAVFAWQSSHRPIQRATTYGLDGAFPSQLQPALIRIYEWASFRWHEFLHQPSRRMPPNTRSSKQQDCPQLEGLQDQDLGRQY